PSTPASRHSTSHASNSESLLANSSFGGAAAGAPARSTINPLECVSTAGRICDHLAVSIHTRPPVTGSMVADVLFTNFGIRGARGFHFVPPALPTTSANRPAIVAGASVLR